MDLIGEIFKKLILVPENLPNNSFVSIQNNAGSTLFHLTEQLMDGAFDVSVDVITDSSDADSPYDIIVMVFDSETGDEYLPVFIDSYQGNYVGAVRDELRSLLLHIAETCFREEDDRPPAWLIPANPKHYDIEKGFRESPDGTLTWTQRIKARAGDTLFIYHTEPIASLTFRCTVVEADIPSGDAGGDGFTRGSRLMRIRKEEQYPKGKYPRSFLNDHGIKKTVRGQRSCPDDLYLAIMGEDD